MLKDLFSDPKLSELYVQTVLYSKPQDIRHVIESDDPIPSGKHIDATPLVEIFKNRVAEIFGFYQVHAYDALDLFKEQAVFDILKLYDAGLLTEFEGQMINGSRKLLQIAQNTVLDKTGTSPEEVLEEFDKGKINIETEEQLDIILLSMLAYKLNNNGRMKKEYCDFVIKQCFDQNSLIMKNPSKYKEIVLRFLEDFAKEDSIDEEKKEEEAVNSQLDTTLMLLDNKELLQSLEPIFTTTAADEIETIDRENHLDFEDKSINNKSTYLDEINYMREPIPLKRKRLNDMYGLGELLRDTAELIRKRWFFSEAIVAKFAKILEIIGPDSSQGKELRDTLAMAYCSKKHNNAAIIKLTEKYLDGDLGGSIGRLVLIGQAHSERLVADTSNDKKIRVLETVFHENTHDRQHRDNGNPKNYLRYLQMKLGLLMRAGIVDYKKIYFWEALDEREAFEKSAEKVLDYAEENGLSINSEMYEEQMSQNATLIAKFFMNPILPGDAIKESEGRSLSDLFMDLVYRKMVGISRKELEEKFGDDGYLKVVEEKSRPKYKDDPNKEIEIDDYKDGFCILKDNPTLRIEFDDRGYKRNFKDFLLNAKRLISKQKFLDSEPRARLVVDKELLILIRSICVYEYMDYRDLSWILYALSSPGVWYNENDPENKNELYKGFIKELVSKELPTVIKDAMKNIHKIPKDELVNLCDICKLLHVYKEKETEAEKRQEFFDGLESIDKETGKTVFELLESLEEKAKEYISIGDGEQGNGGARSSNSDWEDLGL